MLSHRVIPTLLVDNGELVKTKQFKNPKYVGDIINVIRIFNDKEVDEIIVIDISSSKNGCDPNYLLIEELAGECFMPLTYGGGIKSIEHVEKILKLGVEKICLHSVLFKNPGIIADIAQIYGSQTITVSLDVKKTFFGNYVVWDSVRRRKANYTIDDFIMMAQNLGAGEILLNNVDKDGTLSGPDLKLAELVANKLKIPLVASGGVASLDDMKNLIRKGADAVAVGAYFIYHGKHRAVLVTYPNYHELSAISQNSN